MTRLDLRLAPAALFAWFVTAAGIVWSIGPAIAVICSGAGAGWLVCRGRPFFAPPVLRAAGRGLLGIALAGVGFGVAIGVRDHAVDHHPIGQFFGTTAWVTVLPEESPRPVAGGRLMFRAHLARVADAEVTGRVVVFGQGADFGELAPGQPGRFRARISRPTRRDLTVAALGAVGRPEFGRATDVQRAAHTVRTRFAAAAREALPPGQAAILPGLVLGDTATVTATTIAAFRTAGLTHETVPSNAWTG